MKTTMKYLCGIDGYRKGWIASVKEPGKKEIFWRIFEKMVHILPEIQDFQIIAIDIPIGLQNEGRRECDIITKRLLGKRGNSVFDAPIIPVLNANDYLIACSIRESIENKRMSQQAWGIVKKVREINLLIEENGQFRKIVYEVHPEVSFYLMNENAPMSFYKKHEKGFEERVSLLKKHFEIDAAFIKKSRTEQQVPKDELVDALSALWSAERIHRGEHEIFPAPINKAEKVFAVING